MAQTQPFGLLISGQPLITEPSEVPRPTSFVYSVQAPASKSHAHLVVFILPGITIPPGMAAAVYLVQPQQEPRFIGGIGQGKESAIYKLSTSTGVTNGDGQTTFVVGISIEDGASVQQRIEQSSSRGGAGSTGINDVSGPAGAGSVSVKQQSDTLRLANKIISNAFNFLSSFSGQVPGQQSGSGVEVVPLKAFEDWWRKFESKIKLDPSFLEDKDG
jgi:protein Hikeshi